MVRPPKPHTAFVLGGGGMLGAAEVAGCPLRLRAAGRPPRNAYRRRRPGSPGRIPAPRRLQSGWSLWVPFTCCWWIGADGEGEAVHGLHLHAGARGELGLALGGPGAPQGARDEHLSDGGPASGRPPGPLCPRRPAHRRPGPASRPRSTRPPAPATRTRAAVTGSCAVRRAHARASRPQAPRGRSPPG